MLVDIRMYVGLVVAGGVLCGLLAPGGYGEELAKDTSLVLHYAFDGETGETVKDLSVHGNDGKIVKAEYLEELDGRRGVLRFDGEESMLHCPNSDSLDFAFDRDMSFEMTVRLNAPGKPGMLFGDLNNFAFHVGYWNVLTLSYSRLNTELSTHESMVAPVARRILGERWSHITVVVEYPRIRFYHNGELVRDAYMPIPGVQKRFRIAKRIGGWDGRCAPIDLDEFRLYRRALTAAEVRAHARGEQLPPPQSQSSNSSRHSPSAVTKTQTPGSSANGTGTVPATLNLKTRSQAHELAVEPHW